MALQHGRVFPLANLPYARILVPAAAYDELPICAGIECAHIRAVAQKQRVCIVVQRRARLPHVYDLVFAAGHDEAFGERGGGRHDGERVDELSAVGLDGAIEGGR